MRAEKLRRALAEGPMTWERLAAATGLDVSRCMIEVRRLEVECGCSIARRKTTELRLIHDPEQPELDHKTCGWDGCDAVLRDTNETGYCGIHTQAEARRRWQAMSPAARRELAEAVCGDAVAILGLFDTQLSIDDVPEA